jgi:hypothetical protein
MGPRELFKPGYVLIAVFRLTFLVTTIIIIIIDFIKLEAITGKYSIHSIQKTAICGSSHMIGKVRQTEA